jgi:hypothetical protein
MAKRSTTRKSSSLRTVKPAAARLLSHPLARELIAASLVYAAASIIRRQTKSGSLSRRLMQDPGQATDATRKAAGDIAGGLGGMIQDARQAITPALEALMQHFSIPETPPAEAGSRKGARGGMARPKPARTARRRSPSVGSKSTPRPEPPTETLNTP